MNPKFQTSGHLLCLYSPICLSVSVLVGDLEHRFSRAAAQNIFDFLLQKDPMTAEFVACVNFTNLKLLGFDIKPNHPMIFFFCFHFYPMNTFCYLLLNRSDPLFILNWLLNGCRINNNFMYTPGSNVYSRFGS